MNVSSEDTSFTVALVYDRVNSSGGAERVLQALHEIYPHAPLFTSVYDPRGAGWAAGWDVRTSWLQYVPGAATHHRWFGWVMPWIFSQFDVSAYDVVISVSSEAAKAVKTTPQQLHIDYVLTPTRYLWSHQYGTLMSLPWALRPIARSVFDWLQKLDFVAAQQADFCVAISDLVAKRVERYYRRVPDTILYPPVSGLQNSIPPSFQPAKPFVFTFGRHVPYKHFEWAVRAACTGLLPLVIAGDGPQTTQLRRLARLHDPLGKKVFFVGRVSDGELRWYLEHAEQAWFPQIEDFGIAILEAAVAGCPVVAAQQSGAVELLSAADGVFFNGNSYSAFQAATCSAMMKPWSRLDIQRRAQHYAGVRFHTQWRSCVSKWWKQQQQNLG